jgi:hypothetical protein
LQRIIVQEYTFFVLTTRQLDEALRRTEHIVSSLAPVKEHLKPIAGAGPSGIESSSLAPKLQPIIKNELVFDARIDKTYGPGKIENRSHHSSTRLSRSFDSMAWSDIASIITPSATL